MTFWDRVAKRFDKEAGPEDQAIAAARRHLEPGHRVLEIGCATGATARALRPAVASWHGIDISAEMVRRAEAHGGNITYAQGTVRDASGPYDAVVAFNVLHFMDLPADLDRIHALLAPNGILLAQTPCLGDLPIWSRLAFPAIAFVMRIPGLRRLRFADVEAMVAKRFHVVETETSNPTQTWLVARRQ